MKRIDQLVPGTEVVLWFEGTWNNPSEEAATFLGIEGEGDSRTAKFDDQGYEWEAYRFNGRWAYGSGANRLRVIEITKEPGATLVTEPLEGRAAILAVLLEARDAGVVTEDEYTTAFNAVAV